MSAAAELAAAARALARAGLVTAFGHVSVRVDAGRALLTPPVPLGSLRPETPLVELPLVPLDALPPGAPGEAWIHHAIYAARQDAGAICRAQPEVATALGSAGVAILPLHGAGAFVGTVVPVHDDARLVREAALGTAAAGSLGAATALLLRGNGAVTVGATVGEAVARMWVLEASARINRDAAAAGERRPLADAEAAAWQGVAAELLARIWSYLTTEDCNP